MKRVIEALRAPGESPAELVALTIAGVIAVLAWSALLSIMRF